MGNEISLTGKRWEVATVSDRFLIIGATDPLAKPARPIEIFRYKGQNPALSIRSILPAHRCAVWPIAAARIAQNLESLSLPGSYNFRSRELRSHLE
jgi:hypothetical protein